jgi:hypothetical protein
MTQMDDFCALSYAQAVTAQFLIVHTRGFDPAKNMRDFPATNTRDVPVEHGTGDALLIFGYDRIGAGRLAPAGSWPERGAQFLRIAIIAARAEMYTIEQVDGC